MVQPSTLSPPIGEPAPAPEAVARGRPDLHRLGPVVAAGAYVVLALAAWWHAWTGGLGSSVAAGSIDPVSGIWYFAWALHFLAHPTNPFYTHAIFAPGGANVLASPSSLALGVLFAPLTLAVGPVASFGVAAIVAPAAGAFAAFWAARRYVSWQPAAFVAGLCYGFGPFASVDLRIGHLNLAFLAIPPLVLLCLDSLVVRGTRRWLATGLALGLLLVAEFFVSTEIEVLLVVEVLIALVLAAILRPRAVASRLRGAWRGLAVAGGVCAAALAYPAWMELAGPGHVTGPVWKTIPQLSSTVLSTVLPHGQRPLVGFVSSGNGSYLGLPLLALLVGCLFVWRGDRRLRWAVAMAAISFLLSLGYTLHVTTGNTHVPLPGWLFGRLPVLSSVGMSRFGAFVDLFAGLAVALVLDHLRRGDLGRRDLAGRPRAALALAAVVAVAVLLPFAPVLRWPYRVDHVTEPAVLRQPPLTDARSSEIVLEYPEVDGYQAGAMLWQAEDRLAYSLHDGYSIQPAAGGGGIPFQAPDAVELIFAAAQLGRLPEPLPAPVLQNVRASVLSDGARFVVVLPHTLQSARVVADLRGALGQPARTLPGGGALWVLRRPDGGGLSATR